LLHPLLDISDEQCLLAGARTNRRRRLMSGPWATRDMQALAALLACETAGEAVHGTLDRVVEVER
jgi:hypothetical protein